MCCRRPREEAEARSKLGVKTGDFRVKKDTHEMISKDGIEQHVQDYYERILNEVKRGELKPVRLGKWESVERYYSKFLLERIPHNLAQFKKSAGHGVKVALIPHSFYAPLPTPSEKETYVARSGIDDGDLFKTVTAECKKHTTDDVTLLPYVIHSLSPKSPLMICVVVVAFPKA